jgi:hypothetical protein
LAGVCGLDSTGSEQRLVASCCECGDEPSGYCATELVNSHPIPRLRVPPTFIKAFVMYVLKFSFE